MFLYLRTKFQVSAIILISFRLEGNFITPVPHTPAKRAPKKPSQIKVI